MSSRAFLSPEIKLFFVKTHIIHALAETTSEAYGHVANLQELLYQTGSNKGVI